MDIQEKTKRVARWGVLPSALVLGVWKLIEHAGVPIEEKLGGHIMSPQFLYSLIIVGGLVGTVAITAPLWWDWVIPKRFRYRELHPDIVATAGTLGFTVFIDEATAIRHEEVHRKLLKLGIRIQHPSISYIPLPSGNYDFATAIKWLARIEHYKVAERKFPMKHDLILSKLNPEQTALANKHNEARNKITHVLICGPYGQRFGTEAQCTKYWLAWRPPKGVFADLFGKALKTDKCDIRNYMSTPELVNFLNSIEEERRHETYA